jgi:hypothetical protein
MISVLRNFEKFVSKLEISDIVKKRYENSLFCFFVHVWIIRFLGFFLIIYKFFSGSFKHFLKIFIFLLNLE